jgi:hypothetical protein
MRLLGNPLFKQNGYPMLGVVTLLKKASLTMMKNGKYQWKAFAEMEKPPKGMEQKPDVQNAITLTTGFDDHLAKKLIEWDKGTRLLVAGFVRQSDYWTQRTGKPTYEIQVEFVHDQHDYAAEMKTDYEQEMSDGYSAGEYEDPGF